MKKKVMQKKEMTESEVKMHIKTTLNKITISSLNLTNASIMRLLEETEKFAKKAQEILKGK